MLKFNNQLISIDWGTSRLRFRQVQTEPFAILTEVSSDRGITNVFQAWQAAGSPANREGFYLRALAAEVDHLQAVPKGVPLVISGMASSTIGLRELPYAPVPFNLTGDSLPIARISSNEWFEETILVSGVCSVDDIMRGEETILLGLKALGVGDGLFLLPGTHSKHAEVEGGVLQNFRTYLTGEMFALLRDHSILQTCLSTSASTEPDDSFREGVQDAAFRANLLREVFALRARSVLHKTPPKVNTQRLSGLIIGEELRALVPIVADGRPIHLAASEPLLSAYQAALDTLGLGKQTYPIPPEEMAKAIAWGHHRIVSFRQQSIEL